MRTPFIPLRNTFYPRAAALCWWSSSANQARSDSNCADTLPVGPGKTIDTPASVAAPPLVLYDARARLPPSAPGSRSSPPPPHKSNVRFDMTRAVYRQIERTLGYHQPERGGLLGGCRKDGLITHFWHDDSPSLANTTTYEPNHIAVNAVLKRWNAIGIELIGMVHSHPGHFSLPSPSDCEYARRILAHNGAMHNFFMPIVLTRPASGSVRLVPYVVERASSSPFALCELRRHSSVWWCPRLDNSPALLS